MYALKGIKPCVQNVNFEGYKPYGNPDVCPKGYKTMCAKCKL
jgi:hypothetical protein